MTEAVNERYRAIEPIASRIHRQLHSEVEKLGFDSEDVTLLAPVDAVYRLEKDPADGRFSLVGEWRDDKGMKSGSLMFHADGSFFVEQDIVRPHPVRANWFVEAVSAWGRDDNIKSEARLLPMP